eukprot:GHVQ01012714.1.p1 GENE.GHVQ01012714.1~~GHVQ01012714.1.p1  ORF type:complete len:325 (+),score=43.22 GHVQ01012714.1:545-1519(+)
MLLYIRLLFLCVLKVKKSEIGTLMSRMSLLLKHSDSNLREINELQTDLKWKMSSRQRVSNNWNDYRQEDSFRTTASSIEATETNVSTNSEWLACELHCETQQTLGLEWSFREGHATEAVSVVPSLEDDILCSGKQEILEEQRYPISVPEVMSVSRQAGKLPHTYETVRKSGLPVALHFPKNKKGCSRTEIREWYQNQLRARYDMVKSNVKMIQEIKEELRICEANFMAQIDELENTNTQLAEAQQELAELSGSDHESAELFQIQERSIQDCQEKIKNMRTEESRCTTMVRAQQSLIADLRRQVAEAEQDCSECFVAEGLSEPIR